MQTLDAVVSIAREVLMKSGKHAPQMICETPENVILVYFAEFGPGRHNEMAMFGAKLAKEHPDLQQVFFISEAWVSKYKKDEAPPSVRPTHDPNRIEALIVCQASFVDGGRHVAVLEMKRNRLGKLIDAVRKNEPEADYGSFLDAFVFGYIKGRTGNLN
jgi:hypothetical protein